MDIIFDILLAVLLCLAISYGFVLNRRIVGLRKDQQKLEQLAKSFSQATSRAEASIIKLKSTSDATAEALGQTIEQAVGMKNDLIYLLERGNGLADKLETKIRSKENDTISEDLSDRGDTVAPSEGINKRSNTGDAERALIKALRAVR